MVFGNEPAAEAKREFKHNAQCSTIHAYAFSYVYQQYGLGSLTNYLTWRDIPQNMERQFGIDGPTIEHIEAFCTSKYLSLEDYFQSVEDETNERVNTYIKILAKQLLNLMARGSMRVTHSFYLKLFHMYVMSGKIKLKPVDKLLVDECISGEMFVTTDTNAVPMKSLFKMHKKGLPLPKAKSFNEKTQTYEYKQITNVMCNGERETFEVALEGLTKVVCTDNHRLLTQHGWKETKDIVIGEDYLIQDNTFNQKCKYIPNETRLQLILGSYLGDGSLSKRSDFNTYRLNFTQGVKQLNYLKWKNGLFDTLAIKNIKSGYTGEMSIYQTNSSKTFILDNDPFTEVLNKLDLRGLAIWIMDDGSYQNNRVAIHSNAFTEYQNEQLRDMIITRFGFKARVQRTRKYYELHFNAVETKMLLAAIKPYVHQDLQTKFYGYTYDIDLNWDSKFKEYGGNFVKSIKPKRIELVYDLTVEDNHNFIVKSSITTKGTGTVVHNCQDLSYIMLDVVKKIPAKQLILVGDSNQALFDFMKLVNGFEYYPDGKVLTLSKSFRVDKRFAPAIQLFLRKHLDTDDTVFEGMDYPPNPVVKTMAYLTRTNASLIGKMIELNRSSIPYKLSNKAKLKQMFKVPLALIYAKPGAVQLDSELKGIQEDINRWGKLPEASRPGKISYFSTVNKEDQRIQQAIKLIVKFGPNDIIDAYKQAEKHQKAVANLTLMTAYTAKGSTRDSVELDPDLDKAIAKLIPLPQHVLTSEERSLLALYFVACTRHKYFLYGAKYLNKLMDKLSTDTQTLKENT